MLIFDNLSYIYPHRKQPALDGATFAVSHGVTLLAGPNGAGKTTLLGVASGLLRAKSGGVNYDGMNPAERRPSTMSDIFYLTDIWESPFADIATTARYHGAFYPKFDREMLAANLEAFGLTGLEKLRKLSLGMRHKSHIAYALALRTGLLLLDEPANGLDIDSKKELRRMVSRCLGEDQSVIISTHTVADLEALYDHIIIIAQGRVLLSMSASDIAGQMCFVQSATPVEGALYTEPDGAMFRSIVATDGTFDTAIDFDLLYSAVVHGDLNKLKL